MTTERPAAPGERCTCGRPAILVYTTDDYGPIGFCGISDGGAKGPCYPLIHHPLGLNSHHPDDPVCPHYKLLPPKP